MEELLKIAKENNQLLKEILSILKEITSPEHIRQADDKALAINILADIIVAILSKLLDEDEANKPKL